jgi:hypothetical protein
MVARCIGEIRDRTRKTAEERGESRTYATGLLFWALSSEAVSEKDLGIRGPKQNTYEFSQNEKDVVLAKCKTY